jgi:hypothetical protein
MKWWYDNTNCDQDVLGIWADGILRCDIGSQISL